MVGGGGECLSWPFTHQEGTSLTTFHLRERKLFTSIKVSWYHVYINPKKTIQFVTHFPAVQLNVGIIFLDSRFISFLLWEDQRSHTSCSKCLAFLYLFSHIHNRSDSCFICCSVSWDIVYHMFEEICQNQTLLIMTRKFFLFT